MKERAEIIIDAVEVEVVDQPGSGHDPRVGVAVGVAALLGAKQLGLLLRPTDEQHPFGGRESRQVLVHDVVLTFPLGEIHPGHSVITSEAVHRRVERVGDAGQRRGRGDRQSQLPVHVADQAQRVLQLRHIHVAVHAVDTVDLEQHMLGQDIPDGSRYGHHRAPIESGGQQAHQPHYAVSYTGPGVPVTVSPTRPEPSEHRRPTACSSGWGKAPLD